MKTHRAILQVLIFSAAATCGFAADETLPKPEAILDKYLEVTGGKARYEKLTNIVSSGPFEISSQGITGTITIYRAAPNKSHTIMDLGPIGKIEEGVSGGTAWQKSPMTGPAIKEGRQKEFAMNTAQFNNEIDWRDKYDKVELAGIEKVQGQDCYKIVMSGKNANSQTRYYDKTSNLLVKISLMAPTQIG